MIVFWFVNCASSSFARKSCWTVTKVIGTSVQIAASWAALRRWRAATDLCESASIAPSKMVVRMTTKTTMTQNENNNQNNKLMFTHAHTWKQNDVHVPSTNEGWCSC